MVDLKVFAGRGGLGGHPPFRIERQPGGKAAAKSGRKKKCSLLARFRGEMGNLLLLDSRSAGWRESRLLGGGTRTGCSSADATRDSLETASWAPFSKIDRFYPPRKELMTFEASM